MAAPGKQSSRWGSFLQQAVAGVESRLDNILADGVEGEAATIKKPPPSPTQVAAPKSDSAASRPASASTRTNDRLQERLARAIAAKQNAQKTERDSLALSSGVPSRASSPATVSESPRRSVDGSQADVVERDAGQLSAPAVVLDTENAQGELPSFNIEMGAPGIQQNGDAEQDSNGLVTKPDTEPTTRLSTESGRISIPRESIDSVRQTSTSLPRSSTDMPPVEASSSELQTKSPAEYEALIRQLKSDFETAELQRQEELHDYVERIDALQSKLQYLAKETTENARQASNSAPAGSIEKKLADKEEQVGLLMEEGQKLSKKELTHLSTIKKLRAKIQEDSKEVSDAKSKQEKAEKDVTIITERWKRAQGSERQLIEKQRLLTQLQKDVETLKSEKESRDSTIINLRKQLDQAIAQNKQAETQLANEALEIEKKRVAELEDDLANLRIEKSLVADRSQAQIKELREKIDRDAERARMTELEMKTEQQMLESKLEVMRARAEEVSSGATGDAQAKLLRQIETLQTQYAVASENWQGIQASLVAQKSNLEKERDEATRREADIRRKAREVTLKAKRHEDELEETRSKLPTFQQELAENKSKLDALQRRAEEAEAALIEARAAFEQEKQTWKTEAQLRLEGEKQKWQEEVLSPSSTSYSRAESPITSTRRGLTTEFLGLQNLQIRRASARSINNDSPTSGFLGRRPSAQPLGRSSGNGTPVRQDSTQSLKENGENVERASVHTDHEDYFENNTHPSSPQQTLNDMVSGSTAGAGPSVQLIERMSSAVRRLESEKVATKEDLARLSAQRDEARAEIVALMREVEQKRAVDARVTELEAEVRDINSRYQTTLEMLGEKSEMVDELKSDIEDIKAMYRELVERTVK